jgi:hypothetical protein
MELNARRHSREVEQFVARNRDSITRVLGGLQLVFGAVEAGSGVVGVAGGVATSEFGVGVGVAAASAWMVTNGSACPKTKRQRRRLCSRGALAQELAV